MEAFTVATQAPATLPGLPMANTPANRLGFTWNWDQTHGLLGA